MNQEEWQLQQLWQQAAGTHMVEVDYSRLVNQVKSQADTFNRKILIRDSIEVCTGTGVILFFMWVLVRNPDVQARIGCILLIISSLLIIYQLLKTRFTRETAHLDHSLKSQLQQSRISVQRQIHLLSTSLYWSLTPLYIGQVILITSNVDSWVYPVIHSVGAAAIYYAIYRWNKNIINKHLLGLLQNLNEAIAALD